MFFKISVLGLLNNLHLCFQWNFLFSIFMNVVIYNKGDKALALWKQNVQSQRYYTSFYSKERLSEVMFLQEICIRGMKLGFFIVSKVL